MARVKLSVEDQIFHYFASAPLVDAQEQYKRVRGIIAHRGATLRNGRRKVAKKFNKAEVLAGVVTDVSAQYPDAFGN